MNHHETSALQTILGTHDGALEPRPLSAVQWDADWQEAFNYADGGGLAVPSMGDDAAARKQWHRSLAGLERQGYVTRADKELRLTDDGHATARRLAGLPGEVEALDLLAAVATCPARWAGGWISEPSLAGLEPFPHTKAGGCRIPSERLGLLLASANVLVLERLLTWRPLRLGDGIGGDVVLYRLTEAGQQRATAGDADKWFTRIGAAKVIPLPPEYSLAFDQAYRAREHAGTRWPNRVGHLDPVDQPKA